MLIDTISSFTRCYILCILNYTMVTIVLLVVSTIFTSTTLYPISSDVDILYEQNDWVHIGTRKVIKKNNSDIIPIQVENGQYRSLRFQLENGNLNFTQVIIGFRDGSKQIVNLRKTILDGEFSKPIGVDLKGRNIESVEYKYDTKGVKVKKAKVKVYGKY